MYVALCRRKANIGQQTCPHVVEHLLLLGSRKLRNDIKKHSPGVHYRSNRFHPRRVGIIYGIPSRVPCRRGARRIASRNVILWDGQCSQDVRPLDHRCRQAHFDMPLNMAVEEPCARVGRPVAQHRVRSRLNCDGVSTNWNRSVVFVAAWPDACPARRPAQDLEVVPVEMEWMSSRVKIVDDDLNNLVGVDDERVHLAVNDRICVAFACRHSGVQRGNLLAHVREIVEKRPWDVVLVKSKRKVENNQLVIRIPNCLIIVGLESNLIRGLLSLDNVFFRRRGA